MVLIIIYLNLCIFFSSLNFLTLPLKNLIIRSTLSVLYLFKNKFGENIVLTSSYEIKTTYHTIYNLINDINVEHQELSSDYFTNSDLSPLNLKRKQINHITEITQEESIFSIDNDFLKLITTYREKLNFFAAFSDIEEQYNEVRLRVRTKEYPSIINKLKFYRLGKEEVGKIPINKCLNDLLGFRIHLDYFDHNDKYFTDICEKLKESYGNRIDFRDASKGNYKAFHFYLYGESWTYFPWELQIWTNENLETNDESHLEHKQQYTTWAQIYKDSNENELER